MQHIHDNHSGKKLNVQLHKFLKSYRLLIDSPYHQVALVRPNGGKEIRSKVSKICFYFPTREGISFRLSK
jgi:hypothetical protein